MATTVRARWFPASIHLPTSGETFHKVYVLVTDGDRAGVHLWKQPAEEPDWSAPVDFAHTDTAGWGKYRQSHTIQLADGTPVVVTPSGSCGCGSSLRRWAGPAWASAVAARR